MNVPSSESISIYVQYLQMMILIVEVENADHYIL